MDIAGGPDAEVVLPTPRWLKPLEQLHVPDFRGLYSPGLAVNQSHVELIAYAYTPADELVGTGSPSIAQPSRKQASVKRDLGSRSGSLRGEHPT
jgi:hypothetical protein